ncbi:surface polysaccharide O-acyltransferase-like enzyme [Sphingomonas sp. PP-F2F-A104-K0414]|uniref:acyltransferase family protein n=1 Tax=Sphingomonas sp. PP-F2F-A104-K0414 TaxID=2135661 RepID=UPI00104683BD|nr:acyltransferase [Sphingomonas sp. PP-F2F-A104-K0414]TCP95035.1 surface polysaccharide O-acyltransferase-like enzyme [Sphingomonas sp. PP-F2F-A104-K0414]
MSGMTGSKTVGAERRGTSRIEYLETLRGFACLLLVAFHVVGDSPIRGLRLPADHWLSIANHALHVVRMPLFAFISGTVFASFVPNAGAWRGKVLAKARRLLVPMASVSALSWCIQSLVLHNATPPLWQIFFFSYDQFWYLQATFVLMVAILTVSLLLPGRDLAPYALALVPIGYFYPLVSAWQPDVFSAGKAVYLAPYFLLGLFMRRHDLLQGVRGLDTLPGRVLLMIGVLGLMLVGINADAAGHSLMGSMIGYTAGLAICLLAVSIRARVSWLAWIGGKSYPIFLFHVLFAAGTRIALQKIAPVMPVLFYFAGGLGAGLIGPIIMGEVLIRNRITALLFLGIRSRAPGKPGLEMATPR